MRGVDRFVFCVLACTGLAPAQATVEDKIAALKYPDIASRVRVQGDVRVVIDAIGPRIVFGNQMLAVPQIIETARTLAASETMELVFHYQIVDSGTRTIQRKEPKGDAFDRLMLRLLHRRTYSLVDECVEDSATLPPNRAELTRTRIEVWIYTGVHCLQTMTGY